MVQIERFWQKLMNLTEQKLVVRIIDEIESCTFKKVPKMNSAFVTVHPPNPSAISVEGIFFVLYQMCWLRSLFK